MIGPENDENFLKEYTNIMTQRFVEEQVIFYHNAKIVVDFWVITAGKLFTRVIVGDKLPITDILPVELSVLLAATENASI